MQAQQDAASVVEDYSDVATMGDRRLAKIGCSGKRPGNAERDFWTHARRDLHLTLPTYTIAVPRCKRRRKGLNLKSVEHIFLPHEIFAWLFRFFPVFFQSAFGTGEERAAFWKDTQQHSEMPAGPWRNVILKEPHNCCAFRLQGDDAPIRKGLLRLSALIVSFCCAFTTASGFDNDMMNLLIVAMQLKRLPEVASSCELIYKAVRYSFECLAAGIFPETDHLNQPWHDSENRNSFRQTMAGRFLAPLADGVQFLRGFVNDYLGDWKWVKESFALKCFYGARSICHLCFASKGSGPDNFADFSIAGRARRRRRELSVAAVYEHEIPELALLPLFSLLKLTIDFMHTDHLGLCLWLAANTLEYLCRIGAFGNYTGAWLLRMDAALAEAWRVFNIWATDAMLEHSQPCFTAASISMQKGATCWPELKAKAHNASVVCRWLSFFAESLECTTVEHMLVVIYLRAHRQVQDVMSSADRMFTDTEATLFLESGRLLLRSWSRLNRRAELSNQARWQLKPKHHHFEEGLHKAFQTRINPRHEWAYKHESFMGIVAKVCSKVHVSTCSLRTAQRWLLRWAKLAKPMVARASSSGV